MAQQKTGKEFIKHELDEAIAIQQTIVKAERQLEATHPLPDAQQAIRSAIKDDQQCLDELQMLGREHGATGRVEDVAGGLQSLMEETAGRADEAESEAYEATAVLLNLKRKQQDSAAAMLKLADEMQDDQMRKAAQTFQRTMSQGADRLSKELASFAVRIASEGGGAERQQGLRSPQSQR